MSSYVYAKTTCSVKWGKRVVRVVGGDVWHAGDPFVKAHPDLFNREPTVVRGERPKEGPVEQATAAPGEKRTTTTRRTTS